MVVLCNHTRDVYVLWVWGVVSLSPQSVSRPPLSEFSGSAPEIIVCQGRQNTKEVMINKKSSLVINQIGTSLVKDGED